MALLPVSDVHWCKNTLLDQLADECFSVTTSDTVTNSNVDTAEMEQHSRHNHGFHMNDRDYRRRQSRDLSLCGEGGRGGGGKEEGKEQPLPFLITLSQPLPRKKIAIEIKVNLLFYRPLR